MEEMMSDIEAELFASFRRRSILRDISPSSLSMRGSPSHGNISFLHHEMYPAPSPEEQIIRQRSRRQLSHSVLSKRQPLEAIENDTTFLQITPAKDPKFTGLSRKRLLLSPTAASTPKQDSTRKPAKRPRIESSAMPIKSELHAFSTSQLVNVLDKLLNNHPELEQELKSNLTAPDMGPLEEKLACLKRNVFRSLPTVRFGSSRDAYCYRRAKPHLEDFKKSCIEQGKLLVLSQNWEMVVRYVLRAWKYIHQLPNWDEKSHNATKQQCYQALAAQCMVGLKRGHFDREKYQSFRKRLEKASAYSSEIQPCLHHIDRILETVL